MRVSLTTELASGVDALYLSGRAAIAGELLERLEKIRCEAIELDARLPFQFGSLEMTLAPHAFGKYRYSLDHPYGRIGITPSAKLPAIRVQPRAEFLHGVGPDSTADAFRDLLEQVVGPVRLTVSRLDLFADFQGWTLTGDDRKNFVCRARSTAVYEEDEVLNGLTFGKRDSGTISARLYDKTIEMAKSGSGYWPDIWGEAFNPSQPVVRVEFEVERGALREFGVNTPDEVLKVTGSLWTYLTGQWLSLRTPSLDATKSRWPVAPEWEVVRHAKVGNDDYGIDRMYTGKRQGTLANLMPGLVGYLASFGALVNAGSFDELVPELRRYVAEYSADSDVSFDWRVFQKWRELALV